MAVSLSLGIILHRYQSEVSPAHNRGLLGCVEFTGRCRQLDLIILSVVTEERPCSL